MTKFDILYLLSSSKPVRKYENIV